MFDLAVIVPSRGRPQNVARLLKACYDTAITHARIFVEFDADDPLAAAYDDLDILPWADFTVNESGLRLVGILNETALACATHYDAVGFVGDDVVPRTAGWDAAVLGALTDLGSGIVYCNDLLQGEKLPTAVFMTSDIVRTLGWMAPPTLEHLYVDNAWKLLGEGMGRLRYLPHVVLEHMHPAAGKAAIDDTYRGSNSSDQDQRDHAAFDAWVRDGLPGDLAKLRAAGLYS